MIACFSIKMVDNGYADMPMAPMDMDDEGDVISEGEE